MGIGLVYLFVELSWDKFGLDKIRLNFKSLDLKTKVLLGELRIAHIAYWTYLVCVMGESHNIMYSNDILMSIEVPQ